MTWEWWILIVYAAVVVIGAFVIGYYRLSDAYYVMLIGWPLAIPAVVLVGLSQLVGTLGEYLREKWEARK